MKIIACLKQIKRLAITPDNTTKKGVEYIDRFQRHSFKGNSGICERQYEAIITRNYHTVEKGLSYVNYRAGFGKRNIEALLSSMENYIKDGYDPNRFFFQTAISTLEAYIKENRKYDYYDEQLEQRLAQFDISGNEKGGALYFEPKTKEQLLNLKYDDFILSRHSIRHFAADDVDVKDIISALELAQHTPSACNRQGWRTIIVSNKDVIREVLKNQNGNEGFGHEFNKLLIITADLCCFNFDREIHQAFIDGGMYAQSVLNALHFEGLGSVPLSASLSKEQEDNVREILNLKESEMLIMFIGTGKYPDECKTTMSARTKAVIEIV